MLNKVCFAPKWALSRGSVVGDAYMHGRPIRIPGWYLKRKGDDYIRTSHSRKFQASSVGRSLKNGWLYRKAGRLGKEWGTLSPWKHYQLESRPKEGTPFCKSDQRLVYSDLLPELQTEGADSSRTTSSVFQGFFVSHVNYMAPFLKWSQAENKLDTLIGAVSQDYWAYHIPLAQ